MTTAVEPYVNPAVASEVRAQAARKGWNQMQIAALLGKGQSTVSRRLRGELPFEIPELYALAEAWDVPVTTFLPSLEALQSTRWFTEWAKARTIEASAEEAA